MSGPASGAEDRARDPGAELRADWIRDVDAALSAAGLGAQLKESAGCLDVTAAIHQSGRKPGEVIVDEDGYVELHWWVPSDATPQQVTGAIISALAALAAALPVGPDTTQP